MDINDARWMQSPNVKVALYVAIAMLTALYSTVASHPVFGPFVMTLLAGLTVLKAYSSDPTTKPDEAKPVDLSSVVGTITMPTDKRS